MIKPLFNPLILLAAFTLQSSSLFTQQASELPSEIEETLKAINHYEVGGQLLQHALQKTNHPDELADQTSYFLDFPFTDYPIFHVPGLGDFYVDERPDTIKNELRAHNIWEPESTLLIKKYAKPGTTAIDIGSHVGTHTITMSHCVGKSGTVLAFDPSDKIFRELCFNLALNNCDNVIPLKCALGAQPEFIELIPAQFNNEGGSYVVPGRPGTNLIPSLPLDFFEIHNISFIKIDVENIEAEVLDGAIETIKRNRPVILIEIQGNSLRAERLGENTAEKRKESIDKLHILGYKLYPMQSPYDFLALPIEENN